MLGTPQCIPIGTAIGSSLGAPKLLILIAPQLASIGAPLDIRNVHLLVPPKVPQCVPQGAPQDAPITAPLGAP